MVLEAVVAVDFPVVLLVLPVVVEPDLDEPDLEEPVVDEAAALLSPDEAAADEASVDEAAEESVDVFAALDADVLVAEVADDVSAILVRALLIES